MKLNPPNAHRSQIKICEKRQTRCVQFRFMQNAFRSLKPIQKSSKCVWVFRNTGANAFAKNQTRLAYEDKRDLYCMQCPLLLYTEHLEFKADTHTWCTHLCGPCLYHLAVRLLQLSSSRPVRETAPKIATYPEYRRSAGHWVSEVRAHHSYWRNCSFNTWSQFPIHWL